MSGLATRFGLAALLPAVLGAIACSGAAATPRKAGPATPTPAAAHGTPAPRRSPTPFAARTTPAPAKVPSASVPATGGAPAPSVTTAATPYPAATDPPEPLATVAPMATQAAVSAAPAQPASPTAAATPRSSAPGSSPPQILRTVVPAPGQPAAGAAALAPSVVATLPTSAATSPRAAAPAGAPSQPAGGQAAAGPGAAQADASLQNLFQAVSVKELDLPLGFRETLASTKPPLYLGQEASFYAHFTRQTQTGGTTPAAVGVVLLAFPDDVTAAARMRSGRAQLNSYLTSGGGQHVEQADGPTLGDESVSLHLLRTSDGIGKSDGGYEVIWRRGNIVVVVMETGNPEPHSIDDAAAIARLQDQNLADAGL